MPEGIWNLENRIQRNGLETSMAKDSFAITVKAEADGLDSVKSDADRLAELFLEAQEIIERLNESKITVRVHPSRQ